MDHNINLFKKYTENYLSYGDQIDLKINHTFRVVDLCEDIAKSLNLSDEDIELAKICGLLHDIARFEQYKQYNTFADRKSIDHGDLGYEILTNNDFLNKFKYNKSDKDTILNSVRYHNKLSIPENLSERDILFLKILRDADKIDILYLYNIGDITINIGDEEFSKETIELLRNNKNIDRFLIKTKADILSVSLGFPFDINFPVSIKTLKDKDYLNKEIDYYINITENNKTKKQLEEIREIINSYIEKRLENVG